MNVIKMNQEKRAENIRQIEATLNRSLEEGRIIDYKHFMIATMSGLNLSRATVNTYLQIALFNMGIKKEDLEDEKFVKLWQSTKEEDGTDRIPERDPEVL